MRRGSIPNRTSSAQPRLHAGRSLRKCALPKTTSPPKMNFNAPRFRRLAEILSCEIDVRFTPESGHVQCSLGCRLWAKSGHSVVLVSHAHMRQKGGRSTASRRSGRADAVINQLKLRQCPRSWSATSRIIQHPAK
jgi:hypothetical protein